MVKIIVKEYYKEFKVYLDELFEYDFDKMIDEIKRIEGKK